MQHIREDPFDRKRGVPLKSLSITVRYNLSSKDRDKYYAEYPF